jgi:hypothetical protein
MVTVLEMSRGGRARVTRAESTRRDGMRDSEL